MNQINKKTRCELIKIVGSNHELEKILKNYKHTIKNCHSLLDFQYELVCCSLSLNEIYNYNNTDPKIAKKHLIQAQNDMYSLYNGDMVPEKKNFFSNVFLPDYFFLRKSR